MAEGRKEKTRRDRGRHPVAEVLIAMIFGITDFSGVAETSWLGVTTPFYFGVPTFHLFPII